MQAPISHIDPPVLPRDLIQFCTAHFIKKLSLFGSTIHGDSTDESDLDVLVEFKPDHVPGFSFVRIQEDLSKLFHRDVDLHTPNSVSRYFREEVLSEAVVLYAEDA